MNSLKGKVAATAASRVALDGFRREAAASLEVGAPVTISIRPEHVALGHAGVDNVSFAVGDAEQLGAATTLIFPEPGFALQVAGQVPAPRGEAIALNLPSERVHVFDAEEKTLTRRRLAPPIAAGTSA
jgi:ABC-type sugar transport system ATPase subunit